MTRARRLASLERRTGPSRRAKHKTWLDCTTIAELRVLEAIATPHGGLPADDPLVVALQLAGLARLAGHDVPSLAVDPDRPAISADVAAVAGDALWRWPD
jgi:hypothetical protein